MIYSNTAAVVVAIVGLCLSFILGLLRYYTRLFIVKNFGLDDWLSVASLIIKVVCTSVYLDGYYNHGFGRHLAAIGNPTVIGEGFKDLWATDLLYTIGTAIIKVSFALTLMRILQHQNRFHVYLLHAAMWAVIVFSIVATCLIITICSPPQYFWKQATDPWYLLSALGRNPADFGLKRKGSCRSYGPQIGYGQSSVYLASDLTLGIVLPILMLKDLNMRTSVKLTTGLLLAMGAVASIASAVRLAYTYTFANIDILFYGRGVIIWTDIEYSLCLIATSIAMLKPLANKLRPFKDSAAGESPRYGSGASRVRVWRRGRKISRDAEVARKEPKVEDDSDESKVESRNDSVGIKWSRNDSVGLKLEEA